MQQFYKPSGKVSALVLIYAPLTFLILIPATSLLHGIVLFHAPGSLFSLTATIACVVFIATKCADWYISNAKIRNNWVAVISALLATVLFCLLSVIFYCMCPETTWTIDGFFYLLNPSNLYSAAKPVITDKYEVSVRTLVLFTISGRMLYIILIVEALLAFLFIAVGFHTQAGIPFDEKNNQWVKEIVKNFTFIKSPEAFMESLQNHDVSVLAELNELQDINIDYSKFEFFQMTDCCYISVENYRKTGEKKDGSPKHNEEEVCKYLMISSEAAQKLLPKQSFDGSREDSLEDSARKRRLKKYYR